MCAQLGNFQNLLNFNTCPLYSYRITLTLLRTPWTCLPSKGSWTQVCTIKTISPLQEYFRNAFFALQYCARLLLYITVRAPSVGIPWWTLPFHQLVITTVFWLQVSTRIPGSTWMTSGSCLTTPGCTTVKRPESTSTAPSWLRSLSRRLILSCKVLATVVEGR